jgi:hypothetical protein
MGSVGAAAAEAAVVASVAVFPPADGVQAANEESIRHNASIKEIFFAIALSPSSNNKLVAVEF